MPEIYNNLTNSSIDTKLGSTNMEIPGTIYLRLNLTVLTVVTMKNGTFSDDSVYPGGIFQKFRNKAPSPSSRLKRVNQTSVNMLLSIYVRKQTILLSIPAVDSEGF
jgi:hypothetical protein